MSERSETAQQTGPAEERTGPASSTAGSAAALPLRRPYQPPLLECYGRLAEVTRFGGSEILDSGGGLGDQV